LVIDDLVILGRSSPDTLKDNRVSVCAAGYSPKHGFVRLYPTRVDSPLRMWNIVSVEVERNPQDARSESWRIVGSKSDWDSLSDKIRIVGRFERSRKMAFINPHVSGCVNDLADRGRSLGIVEPVSRRCYLADRDDYDPTMQVTLMGRALVSDKHRYGLQPRVEYRCSRCRSAKNHDEQILEWGVYEWMRKNPGNEERVWENLFHNEGQQRILFLVGNQAKWPTSFMVISVLRLPKVKASLPGGESQTLFE